MSESVLIIQIKLLEEKLTSGGPTWIGFCHNDTQYGNMLLHTASPETLEAREDADDLKIYLSFFKPSF